MQGFVLRLPAEACDRPVITVAIEGAGNSEIVVEIGALIIQQGGLVEILDEPCAEGGCGNAEDDVTLRNRRGEAGLRQRGAAGAGAGIGTAGYGVQVFDSAVGSVGVHTPTTVEEEGKTDFERGPVRGNKAGKGVAGSDSIGGEQKFGIGSSSSAANRRLRVAGAATI